MQEFYQTVKKMLKKHYGQTKQTPDQNGRAHLKYHGKHERTIVRRGKRGDQDTEDGPQAGEGICKGHI